MSTKILHKSLDRKIERKKKKEKFKRHKRIHIIQLSVLPVTRVDK